MGVVCQGWFTDVGPGSCSDVCCYLPEGVVRHSVMEFLWGIEHDRVCKERVFRNWHDPLDVYLTMKSCTFRLLGDSFMLWSPLLITPEPDKNCRQAHLQQPHKEDTW
ncbi:uncharacterized protein LOC135116410 [Scylla paramamosain]|uniref:uncharacterized protein LOC135116410 n=1 Tax=Scylla paramamosain TaxID=85552 RepID=UPI003082BF11